MEIYVHMLNAYPRKFKEFIQKSYKKLKNYRPPTDGCCICVVKQEMEWHVKWLIIFFIAYYNKFIIDSDGLILD